MKKKLTKKQRLFYDYILKCYKELNEFPSLAYLKEHTSYKSYNTIYKYLNILEKKGFIKRSENSKKIMFTFDSVESSEFLSVPIINDTYSIKIQKSPTKKDEIFVAYVVKDNKLKSENVFINDILVIEKKLSYLQNKLVLVYFDNEYRIFKYEKKDGYIRLTNDKENHISSNPNIIIGKVVRLIRELAS